MEGKANARPGVLKSARERERDVVASSPLQTPGLKAAKVDGVAGGGEMDVETGVGLGGGVPVLPGSGATGPE